MKITEIKMWGTKEYFAPELIEEAYGPQADVWAVGCIMYEVSATHVKRRNRSKLPTPLIVGERSMVVIFRTAP
jgi:serine/threonine protein kinase